jgi:DNA-binding response OmpR family regulator
LGRLQILLVDSDPITFERMQQALGPLFSLQCVTSVSDARTLLGSSLPDLLITEVRVGQESGLELCRYIRSTPALRTLPIMFLTSLATLQDKVAGFHAGTDDYVVKPFDAHHLRARIKLLARIKRLERRTGA